MPAYKSEVRGQMPDVSDRCIPFWSLASVLRPLEFICLKVWKRQTKKNEIFSFFLIYP